MIITACSLCCKAKQPLHALSYGQHICYRVLLLTMLAPYLDTVPEGMSSCISSCAVTVSKDNARAVQQAQVLVQDHFLNCTGHPRGVTHLSHPGSLQTVQQRALAHIGKPNHS